MLKETSKYDYPLYAKIGCRHRDTYTSTKLQLIVYKDKQCSMPYSDDETKSDGYDISGYFMSNKVSSLHPWLGGGECGGGPRAPIFIRPPPNLPPPTEKMGGEGICGAHSTFESSQSDLDTRSSSQVSFRPPFYSCQGCHPEQVSDSFSTRYSAWYDDDYISTTGQKRVYSSNSNNDQGGANDDQGGGDDADDAVSAQTDDGGTAYYQQNDDYYSYAGTDDASNGNDDAATATDDANANDYEVNTDDKVNYNYKQHDDDFYSLNDDNRRGLRTLQGRAVVPFDSGLSLTARETRTVSFVGGVNPKTR